MMNKFFMVPALATFLGLPCLGASQELGKVISSTPVTREVANPQKQCAPDADPRDACRTVTTYETRTIGYKVVYEYAGKQHAVQLPFAPGATIELQITPAAQTQTSASAQHSYSAPEHVYSERSYREPVVEETYFSSPAYGRSYYDQAYYDRSYYDRAYYDRGYYASPIYPLLGVALGYSWGAGRVGFGYGGRGYYSGYNGYWGRGWPGYYRGR